MNDPFAIVEEPVPLPEGLADVDLALEFSQLLERCGRLERLVEATRRESESTIRRFLLDLLEVVDALERIQAHQGGEEGRLEERLERQQRNVEATRRLLAQKLARSGVVPLELAGRPFDPEVSDADAVVSRPELAAETVVEEIVTGYSWNGAILRRGRVVISSTVSTED